MTLMLPQPRLLAGPALSDGPESWTGHRARLGACPSGESLVGVIDSIDASGLLGRGGAGFPVATKWRAVADRPIGSAVVLANGAEGEPASAKDRVLMATRPHLVIDGAVIAAEAIAADEVIVYVGREHTAAVTAMASAIRERAASSSVALRMHTAPIGYLAGEASAAVRHVDTGDARPTTTPPRISAVGIGGQPTLVQNVESLAVVALIARYGTPWYRSLGRRSAHGPALVTLNGPVRRPGVREIELGSTIREVVDEAGGLTGDVAAILVGGYFGTWIRADDGWDVPLDPAAMRARGLSFGCGIVGLLGEGSCGVRATSDILAFMAGSSAGQCGPCVFGLGAIADAMARIAHGSAGGGELAGLERWAGLVVGRGACRHPDGTVQLLESALEVFGDDIDQHIRAGRCGIAGARMEVA